MKPALALVFLAASGCSPRTPTPPVITSVQADPTVPAGQPLDVDVTFVDDDDLVTTVRIAFPSLKQSEDKTVPLLDHGKIAIKISFPSTTDKGPFEYDLSLLDQANLESEISKEMVTIE